MCTRRRSVRSSAVQVGVVEDDRRGLAAEFEGDRPQQSPARFGDPAARGGGAGERDLVDARMFDQVGTHFTAAGNNVEDTVG